MRGNQFKEWPDADVDGPIPARAGEPIAKQFRSPSIGAYPRSRGGTAKTGRGYTRINGLSPQARGNPVADGVTKLFDGPIPARAGEPVRSE